MKFSTFAALYGASFVAGQVSYPNLPVDYLHTTTPVTPLIAGYPWGTRTANNTDPYTDAPNTGVIRAYDFTVSRGMISPDGFPREALLINGQFPGPLIEANWGDTIQVTVTNAIDGPEEGTSIHWHGLLQKQSQWEDGVPGVSQCPIPANSTFTYSFIADLYGTTWYHSHYSAQYAGGVLGPLVIYGPQTVPYDIDVGPVLITDYYHKDYLELVEQVMTPGGAAPSSDNDLINGHNSWNCSGLADNTTCDVTTLASFQLTSGKVHRLRLINAGAEGLQKFSIDGHNLTVIANDFVPIIPYDTQVVTLGIGQRTDILVTGLENPSSAGYLMRSDIVCSVTSDTGDPSVGAIVYYTDSPPSAVPDTQPVPSLATALTVCQNDALNETTPWYSITPATTPATTQVIDITFGTNASGNSLWFMNGQTFRTDYNAPILLLAHAGNDTFEPEWNVYDFGSNDSIRFVINNNIAGSDFAAHPIHLHGHNFHVLDSGVGSWDGTIVNPTNPQRRDVQLVPAGGYIVLQIEADNPGAWPLHCHIAWHVSAGLYVTVLERPADIEQLAIPSIMAQTCRDWANFTDSIVLDQIDSGE